MVRNLSTGGKPFSILLTSPVLLDLAGFVAAVSSLLVSVVALLNLRVSDTVTTFVRDLVAVRKAVIVLLTGPLIVDLAPCSGSISSFLIAIIALLSKLRLVEPVAALVRDPEEDLEALIVLRGTPAVSDLAASGASFLRAFSLRIALFLLLRLPDSVSAVGHRFLADRKSF